MLEIRFSIVDFGKKCLISRENYDKIVTIFSLSFKGLWCFSVYDYKEPTYNRDTYFFPSWAIVIGWCISATSLAPIPIVALYKIFSSKAESLLEVSNLH